ncbi:hypothetical protein JMJ35_008110 [Cladonia borealis]|uniref:Uncharacterized protein n=1 Tax=Cladonia borealis TaxID=184061 RepID=A0AA39QWI4_9LECA|nr:hypothetical protein JMJ35_008110 [Cladonia borealis]
MDKFFQGVMKVIVGKALTNRYLSHQDPKRTSQKSHRRWLSDKDLRHTHNLMPERSVPIDAPSAKTSLGCQRRPCGSTVMAPATGPTPEMELEIPFPHFLNMSSHHAHPHSNMDHRFLPEKPPTPSFMIPLTHKSQKELQEEKDAEDQEMLKTKAIRQWKIKRSKEFLPPPFAPPADYSYGPEDFELADDFDRIIFLPLEEELLTWYWSNDITSRIASARSAMPTQQDIEPSSHPQLIRVKAEGDLAAWKMSKQKQVQWARDSEKPKNPESHISQEPNIFKSSDPGAQPCVPMKRLQSHESEAGESSSLAAEAPQTLHGVEGPTEESHESSEVDFYSSEESYEGSEWTDEDSDYYDDPSSDLFISTKQSSWSSEKGKARCVEV